jgi:DNA-binding transcriptional LysR family regulator
MSIELRHLRYFLALADELNFSRAAERLGIAQPPLTRQMHALERNLGVRLFDRGTRRVALTDAGRILQHEARAAVERVEQATEIARRAGRGETGRLSVGFGPLAEIGVAPRLISTFARRHVDVRLELHGLRAGEHASALRDGTVQATFVVLPVTAHPDVTVERLCTLPLAVAVSRQSPLARRASLGVPALADETMLMFARPFAPGLHDAVVGAFRDAQVPLTIAHESSHVKMMLALVAAGVGVTVLPRARTGIFRDGVAYVPLKASGNLELGVVYRQDHASQQLRKFLHLARRLARDPRARVRPDVTLN